MTEELKIIAEILKNVTDGALIGTVTYMILDFLKEPIIFGVVGFTAYKITKLVLSRPTNVIKIQEVKDI